MQGLSAVGVVGIAGCLGSGDGDGADDGSTSDDATDSGEVDDVGEESNSTDDDGDDADDGADDNSEDDGEDEGNSTAEITLLGETYSSSGLRVDCYDEGTTLASTFETEFHVGADLWVTVWDDHVDIRSTVYTASQTADDYDSEEDTEQYTAEVDHDDLKFDIDEGGSSSASGAVHLDPGNEPAADANPDGVDVEFEIEC